MDPKTLNALVHDREAAFYDERFAITYDKRIGKVVERELTRLLGSRPRARRALDYCCGTGFAAIGMAAAGIAGETHGCDLSPRMLEKTRANAERTGANVHLALCDGERLPYASGSFDLVVARGALHHLPNFIAALREIRRVLALDGTAVVLAEPTPNGERQVAAVVGTLARGVSLARKALRRPIDAEHHHWELASRAANLHTFTPSILEDAARQVGFTDVQASTASWSWVLALGINYYLAGESRFVEKNPLARRLRYAAVESAALFDRVAGDRIVPPQHRATVQAVLR